MKFIQATLGFYPEQKNPTREHGWGVWRVLHCAYVSNPLIMRVERHGIGNGRRGLVLKIMAPRFFKKHSRVDPKKWIPFLAGAKT